MIRKTILVTVLAAVLVGCSFSSSPGAAEAPPGLKWTIIDETWGIRTACGGDGIRLYVNSWNAGALAAVTDHTCDK